MSKAATVFITLIGALFLAAVIYFGFTPGGRATWNTYQHTMQKVDDATLYETRKKVEDACRSMQASYEADRLTYQQYKDSDNNEKQSWAEQAKMRANKTAASYNEFVLKNSYVWDGNVPADIRAKLPYIE